jgi:hypothetical protein
VTATTFEIKDVTGDVVAIHKRRELPDGKKALSWHLPDGRVGLDGMPVRDLPLYGIHALGADATVLLVEGEKSRDALAAIGLPAVATVTGAATTPSRTSLADLTGRRVVLWADNDDEGRRHMTRIAAELPRVGCESIGWIDWLGAPPKGDAADFLAQGGTRDDVIELVRDARRVLIPVGDVSAQTPKTERAETVFRFRTAREIADSTPVDVPWRCPFYVADGAVTEFVGKIKAAGKTTLVTFACRAMLDGREFLGWPTRKTGVVYLSEQPATSLRETLRRADLLDRDDFVLLEWAATSGASWSAIVESAIAECEARDAKVLVVDTLSRWADIRGDGENSAGEADEAMAPLQRAAARGLAVIVIRHERKSGGDVGDSGRGSSAFGGAVDIVVAIRRGDGNTRPTIRYLHALSRFDETPETLVVELTDSGYVALGDETTVATAEARQRVKDVLPAGDDGALTLAELSDKMSKTPRTTLQRAVDELILKGDVSRIGAGKRGDPFRYFAGEFLSAPLEDEVRAETPGESSGAVSDRSSSLLSAHTSTPSGAQTNGALRVCPGCSHPHPAGTTCRQCPDCASQASAA